MHAYKFDDPRDTLAKLTRRELEHLARKEGRADIKPGMPAPLMRARFRERPPSRMPRPLLAKLGIPQRAVTPPYDDWLRLAFAPEQEFVAPVEAVEVDALADLERQWSAQAAPPVAEKPKNEMAEARAECKRRGIKVERTDKLSDLRAKLDGSILA